jgi:hypothetical protein
LSKACQWVVSGPATLVGAPVYTTDITKYEEMEGTMYIDAPAFNIIRSAGKPGAIKVRVLSPGLASAEVVISATKAPKSAGTAIVEPPLPETKRQPVAREGGVAKRSTAAMEEMKGVSEDIQLAATSREDYARQIERFLREKNPGLDFSGPEFRAVVAAFASLLDNNHGSLARDGFNFIAGFFNDCRQITRPIAALNLPALFKQSLREYYARVIIRQGEAKDADAEMRWLASLPDGKVVVAGGPSSPARETGVLCTDRADLEAMVTLAVAEFRKVDKDRKAALLNLVATLNPRVARQAVRTGGEKVDGVRQKTIEMFTYAVAPGQPVLVPDLKFLDNATRKARTKESY